MYHAMTREARRGHGKAREIGRKLTRAVREANPLSGEGLSGGEQTALYVVGGAGVLALVWLALRAKPTAASTSTTSTTAPATPSAPSATPTTPATPAPQGPSMAGAQAYISAASQGNALPWSPPAGAVAPSPSSITPTTVVTDPALIAMAQHALYYIGLTASTYNLTITPYPVSGITGQITSTFTSALASYQTANNASGGGGFFGQGNTPLNSSGTLDYKTLGVLIFSSLLFYVRANGMTSTNSNGLDSGLLSLEPAAIDKATSIFQPTLSTASTGSQLRALETLIDLSSNTSGALFTPVGVLNNWQGWSVIVALGA